ncbi:MAG: hypothetical protein GEU82_08235 [Luteitalea sp.]|nr:hypothetical protein [Luteitalea sp.]
MTTLPNREAFERIRAEYLEMPGMRLTLQQVQRLSGFDTSICAPVLDSLVQARFLDVGSDGSYARATASRPLQPPDWAVVASIDHKVTKKRY